jgi:hypothetical protein
VRHRVRAQTQHFRRKEKKGKLLVEKKVCEVTD